MKKLNSRYRHHQARMAACVVPSAALMLGVSEAATVGINFQNNYCGASSYSGAIVTTTAFGVAPTGWENLLQMDSGYSSCSGPLFYNLNQVIDTTTSTDGLNPLPNGSLNIAWAAATANVSGFSGGYPGNTGEQQVYHGFLRDGVNFGPGSSGGNNNQAGYSIDITGLKTVFTNTPFVIQLVASADSMQFFTNSFIIDASHSTTQSVVYPSPYLETPRGDTPWVRGYGGGLSTVTPLAIDADHIQIMGNRAAHGGSKLAGTDYNFASTISGFIITDKPVVTMSPQPVFGGPGDTVTLNPYAIGLPPLSFQWRLNGKPITDATNLSYSIPALNLAQSGNYDLVVANSLGSSTSRVAAVTVDVISMTPGNNYVADSNPDNAQRVGVNSGASWLASSADGSTSRSGVMKFVAANTNSISVPGTANFDSATGTVMFWMRSEGTDQNTSGQIGAILFGRAGDNTSDDFAVVQNDSSGLYFQAPGNGNVLGSAANLSDNKWHLIALTFDQSASGSVSLYIDGVLDTTSPNSSAWSMPAGSAIMLGSSSDAFWRSYNGLLDDVRVYSRRLSGSEIASVYSSGALVDTSTLQMQLNFDSAPGKGYALSWQEGAAVLQSATNVMGPYTDVVAAPSPYLISPKSGQRFYRYRYTPTSRISNPHLM